MLKSLSQGEETCRTCLKKSGIGVRLYETCGDPLGKSKKYSELLSECSGIYTWEGDGLPNLLCQECCQMLPQVWTFLAICKTSDSKLRGLYVDHKPECKVECVPYEVEEPPSVKTGADIKIEYVSTGVEELGSGETSGTEIIKVERISYEVEEAQNTSSVDDDQPRETNTKITVQKKRKKLEASQKKETIWKCKECDGTWETELRLKKHYKTQHPDITYTYDCRVCGRAFHRERYRRVHQRVHTGERPYKCDTCGACFSQWGTLRNHKYSHTGERPFDCRKPECGAAFSSMPALRRHERIHTGERHYVCELCGHKFISSGALQIHLTTHSNARPYSCSQCHRSFKTYTALKTHENIHGERNLICEECGKKFYAKCNLNKHLKKMHGEGAGTCPVCHKSTSDLKEHAKVHSEELNCKCKICNKEFRHKAILNSHMARHKNANKHKCPAEGCSMAFYRRNLLNFHYNKVHANNTPHHCSYCTQGFYRLSDLTRHINTAHKSQERSCIK